MPEAQTKVGEMISDVEGKASLRQEEGSAGIISLFGRSIFQTHSKAHDLQVTVK
jgi:hypothetical protein